MNKETLNKLKEAMENYKANADDPQAIGKWHGAIIQAGPALIALAERTTSPVSQQQAAVDIALEERVRDAIAAALGEAMDCTRVWSAWSYGTMGPDDFSVVANDDDRLDEIVQAALAAMREQQT